MTETAWKVAAAHCREVIVAEMMQNIREFSPARVSARLNSLPMPPAFAAAVEAEMGEVVELFRGFLSEVLEYCDGREDVNWEGDGPNAEMRLGNLAREMEARLSAKGKKT